MGSNELRKAVCDICFLNRMQDRIFDENELAIRYLSINVLVY